MSVERPTIATYEPAGAPAEEQELVQRPMNDEELEEWLASSAQGRADSDASETRPSPLSDDELIAVRRLLEEAEE